MKKLLSNTINILTGINNVLGSDARLERADSLKYRTMYNVPPTVH